MGNQHHKILSKLHGATRTARSDCGKQMRTIEVPCVAYMIVDEVDARAAGCTRFGRHAYGALLEALE